MKNNKLIHNDLTLADKCELIDKSKSKKDVPVDCYPKWFGRDYYFVSYSHNDYKAVYKDMLLLQEENLKEKLNLFYDFAFPYGEDWQQIADDYIQPYRCVGVIFYVSKSSLSSEAIHKEMEYVKNCGKPCATFNLPYIDNQGNNLGVMPAIKMLDEMEKEGIFVSKEKRNLILQLFNDNVLFADCTEHADVRINKLVSRIKQPPLLEFDLKNHSVVAINDIDATHVNESDFRSNACNDNLLTIKKISDCAFANSRKLKSIKLPKTVSEIGNNAFFSCTSLESIDTETEYIGQNAFKYCRNLKTINLNKVSQIASGAFWGCSKLTYINIPSTILNIGRNAFLECDNLSNIQVGYGNAGWESIGNCLISKRLKAIVFGCKNSIIPFNNNVNKINKGAFYNCIGLTSIIIPPNILEVEKYAFVGCDNLNVISVIDSNPNYHSFGNCLIETATRTVILGCMSSVLPEDGSVENIGSSAFQNCTKLKEISIPNGVINIGEFAFAGCSGLISITLPESLTFIGKGAFPTKNTTYKIVSGDTTDIDIRDFDWCRGLKEVNIFSISKWCGIEFEDMCSNPITSAHNLLLNGEYITDLIIPRDVTEIKNYAFAGCKTIRNVVLSDRVIRIGEYAFYDCSQLTKMAIPENVQYIGAYAFFRCNGLTEITIKEGVSSIGACAFNGCNRLKKIIIPVSIINIGDFAFGGCNNLEIQYAGTKEQWSQIKTTNSWDRVISRPVTVNGTVHCIDGDI